MEYFQELVLLGVDVLVLVVCSSQYLKLKKNCRALKEAPQLPIDENLSDRLRREPDQKLKYAVIRGSVTPIGTPLHSAMSPSVTGVLQTMTLTEHRVARAVFGFWQEEKQIIHVSSNEIPFRLVNGKHGVEIVNGLSAELLDMDTVYENYEPSSLSLFDHVFGLFSGVRQKGLQTTEELLRDGSFITAVGELELDDSGIRLQPASTGAPMFLTTATKNTLLKRLEEAKSSTLVKVLLCGTISAVLVGLIARKMYKRKKTERDERKLREQLDKTRAARRARMRQADLTDEQRCVVCVVNPKEVICLPCGHVCLCENCAEKIKLHCPVCRSVIETKAAAFIT
ncbi:mitochondrial E3 ubiquitin protein ligase 1 [Anopheles cruzii]|uniref:mitochondrial E3 ubiquitin protein ligase 1 n=1 Tax=Anopheles cruzii TaxID=68878 RepID=UPI0022EC5932|nr:mitochondrial E3 ubiquitin protein ligase 1 [Anopheles cruzii]XP_052862670.1 mitochondrial E3 ubiquitin protein ligase 1 [Anopheles cruzii]XP_052862671.1 mitochondrial E3 ubiquitin protein ligase 1 [Anopheles cruzii]